MTEHSEFKVGDRVYCKMRKKHGFITRTTTFGLSKTKSLGVQWDDKTRDVIIGEDKCCMLKCCNECDEMEMDDMGMKMDKH